MNKKHYLLISISLLISLFIYLFYRTEKTLVNEILIQIISYNRYVILKSAIVHALPLYNTIIYSLPEGLWVFSITLTSLPYYIRLGKWRLDGVYIPLIFCISLELMQLVHITNGRFDFMDIIVSLLFWLLARYSTGYKSEKQPVFNKFSTTMLICLFSYGIVYLAHVLK